ncbi:MAG: diguanylate cyclase [Desulfobacteraceae bacterium]|nr:diguanylate cyclase [Desulfobacteraceae bacterium]MBU4055122.1 GGDEF domain-containing protein [Pseudomonadota bacterium]
MGLFSKKKTKNVLDVEAVQEKLLRSDEEKVFYFSAVRSLLVFVKQFPLHLKEMDTEGFSKHIDSLMEELAGEKKVPQKESLYDKSKKKILDFIQRYKQYLEDREKEFKEIIGLLTTAMADIGADNQEYHEKIQEKTDRIEKLTDLDDIKIIKNSIKQEVSEIRTAVNEKQKKDTQQISLLSEKVSVLEEALKKAESKSLRDGLTGIYNRMAFDRKIKQMIDNQAVGNGAFSLLMIDIDDFKKINDQYGHPVGDRVILAVVRKFLSVFRTDDFSARYGGEEFAVILAATPLKTAMKKAKEVCKSLASTRYAVSSTGGQEIKVTVSIGVAQSAKGDTEGTVISRADKALYKAKNTGKNRMVSEKEI